MTTGTGPAPYRAYAAEETVNGEGVALELPVASLGARVVSGALDVVVNGLVLWALAVFTLSLTASASEAVEKTATILVVVAVLVGIPAASEALTRGRTLGKAAMGLRVVRDDGGPIGSRHALTRALVGWVEVYLVLGMVAAIAGLSTPRTRRLGDLAAGTYVVSERTRLVPSRPPSMPMQLASWAPTTDIGSFDRGLDLAVRQFLDRADALAPEARAQHAAQLLGRVLGVVSPLPPPGQHPETVLRAVAAERYRRDLQRLARERQLRERLLPRRA